MLLQGFRLLLAALSVIGWAAALRRRYALRAELAIFLALSGIGLVLFIAGCVGALLWSAWGVFAGGLVMLALSLRRRERLRELFTPGLVFFCVFSAFFLVILYRGIFTHPDNFSHWAAATKRLLELDRFPKMGDRLVYATAYHLGSASLIYYFSRISGVSADWFQAWTQCVYMISCASTFFCFIDMRKKTSALVSVLLTAFLALCLLCGDNDPCDLLVDTLLPMAGLGGLSLCLYCRERSGAGLLPMIIAVCFPAAVKNSGFFYSVLIIAFAAGCWEKPMRLRRTLALAGSVVALYCTWQLRLRIVYPEGLSGYHALNLQSFSVIFSGKSSAELRLILSRFLSAVASGGRLPTLLLCAALTALLILLCAKSGRRALLRLLSVSALIWLGYTLCLLGVYLFSMAGSEGTDISAFDRYYASVLILMCGYFWLLDLSALREADAGSGRGLLLSALAAVGCAAMLMCLRPRFEYCVPQRLRAPEHNYLMRSEFNELRREYSIPDHMSYIVFAKETDSVYARILTTYSLAPSTTYICTEAELDGLGEGWRTFDCYIVLDDSEPFGSFADSTFGPERAGYTYQRP